MRARHAVIRVEVVAMSEFSDLLRMILDDTDAFNSEISTQLDPNLVDNSLPTPPREMCLFLKPS